MFSQNDAIGYILISLKGPSLIFFNILESLVSQESSYFSHYPWLISQLKSVLFVSHNENMHGYGTIN